jgi:hypothetical protein
LSVKTDNLTHFLDIDPKNWCMKREQQKCRIMLLAAGLSVLPQLTVLANSTVGTTAEATTAQQ